MVYKNLPLPLGRAQVNDREKVEKVEEEWFY